MTRFQVTQNHIDIGERNSTRNCPIALALNAIGIEGKRVLFQCIQTEHEGLADRYYQNLATLSDWIKKFDKGKKVKPVEVIMEKGIARIA